MLAPSRLSSLERSVRRGTIGVETLFSLLILTLAIFGAVGLADLIIAEQRLDEASGRAARVAAVGGSPEEIRAAVVAVLGSERGNGATIYVGPLDREVRQTESADDAVVESDTRDRTESAAWRDSPGVEFHPVRSGAFLEVRIEVDARAATSTKLARVYSGQSLLARTVMQRE